MPCSAAQAPEGVMGVPRTFAALRTIRYEATPADAHSLRDRIKTALRKALGKAAITISLKPQGKAKYRAAVAS
jgi:divalent metal cation (Fe/Co/Zn/Cd) transporter